MNKFILLILTLNLTGIISNVFAQGFTTPSGVTRDDLLYDRKFNHHLFENVFSENEILEDPLIKSLSEKQQILQKLMRIKYSIISGNFERAKVEIIKLKTPAKFGEMVRNRYMAMIYFLEGNFRRSFQILDSQQFSTTTSYAKICHLKVLNMVILSNKVDLKQEWLKCRKITYGHEKNDGVWMDNIVKLKLNEKEYVSNNKIHNLKSLGLDVESVKTYLKMALYLNMEDVVAPMIPALPVEFFYDDTVRELMGHFYYRTGKFATAFDFVEDLTSPNAENIKGNIYLTQNQYELAYAQFKLALRQKEDSMNAIERVIPLAWILKQWEEGISYNQRLHLIDINQNKRIAVETVFLIQLEKFEKALENLQKITLYSKYSQPHEVNQLYAYTALMTNDKTKAQAYSDLACKRLDGVNCWLLAQLNYWENFTYTAQRDEEVSNESIAQLDQLLAAKEDSPIEEDIYIDQRDIEELDNNLIDLAN